jgi:hypothetical protein
MLRSAAIISTAIVGMTACASPDKQPSESVAARGYTQEDVAAMSTEEKILFYNENIEEAEKLVCRNERAVGTHFRRTRCFTRAEIEQMRKDAQEIMEAQSGRVGSPFPDG